ncbi:hypothetical protein [Chitinophaga rhizosphaerae]|uniref:hypothetical protein n=1 Tax=Chitinophaga rhizosphaerae TaxID=1864947 RepID=UPI0013DF9A37|nr:hypothetical protein [Chitinophaga rhizosphaerae]
MVTGAELRGIRAKIRMGIYGSRLTKNMVMHREMNRMKDSGYHSLEKQVTFLGTHPVNRWMKRPEVKCVMRGKRDRVRDSGIRLLIYSKMHPGSYSVIHPANQQRIRLLKNLGMPPLNLPATGGAGTLYGASLP